MIQLTSTTPKVNKLSKTVFSKLLIPQQFTSGHVFWQSHERFQQSEPRVCSKEPDCAFPELQQLLSGHMKGFLPSMASPTVPAVSML